MMKIINGENVTKYIDCNGMDLNIVCVGCITLWRVSAVIRIRISHK